MLSYTANIMHQYAAADNFRFRLNENFLLLLWYEGHTYVSFSNFISHFSTLFENFISCSREILLCVFLELEKPYLRQYVPLNNQLNWFNFTTTKV